MVDLKEKVQIITIKVKVQIITEHLKHLCLGFVSEESAAVLTPVCTFINLCGTVHVHTLPLGSTVDAESSHAFTAVQRL